MNHMSNEESLVLMLESIAQSLRGISAVLPNGQFFEDVMNEMEGINKNLSDINSSIKNLEKTVRLAGTIK